jgi:hypothetical protein
MSRRKTPPRGSGSDNYKVGKGRPPAETQWKPGQSGNPPGRKKGSKNRKTIVRSAERKTITVTKGGRKRKMTFTEIGLEHLQQDVARGDRKAFLDYLAILERYNDRDENSASMKELLADDAAILANLLARKKRQKPK